MNPELVGRMLHVTSEPDAAGRWPFRSNPLGVEAAHTWLQVATLLWGLDTYGIQAVVELGTWKGGLGVMLATAAYLGKWSYVGIESNDTIINRDFTQVVMDAGEPEWADLWVADVFDPATIARVSARIAKRPAPALIYCDDGDKPRELRTYAPALRLGDYIAAHDYPWEVKVEDFQPLLASYGLIEVSPEVWREGIGIVMLRKVTP